MEKTLLLVLTLLFIGAFMARNIAVQRTTRKRVRSRDKLVVLSVVFTTVCFLVLFASMTDMYDNLLPIRMMRMPVVSYAGFLLFAASIIMGWIASGQMKESWRVGVIEEQKTELVQRGIFVYIRNPYFLSLFVMFFAMFLIRPSLLLFVCLLMPCFIFHRMVLKEERYLSEVHGKNYDEYRSRTGRYFPKLSG